MGRISRVHNQFGAPHDIWIVVAGMISHDQNAVEAFDFIERSAGHVQIVLAPASHGWEVWIVVADFGTFFLKELNYGQ